MREHLILIRWFYINAKKNILFSFRIVSFLRGMVFRGSIPI